MAPENRFSKAPPRSAPGRGLSPGPRRPVCCSRGQRPPPAQAQGMERAFPAVLSQPPPAQPLPPPPAWVRPSGCTTPGPRARWSPPLGHHHSASSPACGSADRPAGYRNLRGPAPPGGAAAQHRVRGSPGVGAGSLRSHDLPRAPKIPQPGSGATMAHRTMRHPLDGRRLPGQ